MATLVLTAAGGAIGGPVGAGLGGLLGRAVDARVLAPKGRQGPRLTELAVQTSSYGSQIARLFGTMRVAGTVIWATDLREARSTSGGKGQPRTTNYSYSASFAVLLSGRPIGGVGRIWAEGKLLRGAAGDWKTATGFRLHLGGEEQAVDPLIASAEGMAMTPAHRGCAYAVFEDLQLADFGNRIPSLTFEVFADAGPVTVGAVLAELSGGVIDGGDAVLPIAGFAASGDAVRGVAELLMRAEGGWFTARGRGLAITHGGAVAVLADEGATAEQGRSQARRARATEPLDTVPRTLVLAHYDPARDYQTGVQRARRPGPGRREERIDMPAALDAGAARTLAEAMLLRAEDARRRRTLSLGPAAMAVAPGQAVRIAGEEGAWRVTETALENMAVQVTLAPIGAVAVPVDASPGRVLAAPDLIAGPTILHAFEMPALDDAVSDSVRITVAATGGAGWRSAVLLYSVDDGASCQAGGTTAAPARLGRVTVAPRTAGSALIDRTGWVEVVLTDTDAELANADDVALDGGANLAIVGDELLQFGRATALGGGRWRLSYLWRGRRGTEWAAGRQVPGDRFVTISASTAATIELPLATLGTTVRLLASGVGDAEPVAAAVAVTGASVVPPAPVLLRVREEADGGATVTWVRRSRAGWRWLDGGDVPLGEEGEAYRVTVSAGDGATREVSVASPGVRIEPGERGAGPMRVAVRQRGRNGESRAAEILVSGR